MTRPNPNKIYPNENLKWWDWDADKIFRNMEALCSGDLTKIRNIKD